MTRVGKLELRVPQDRQGRFRTEVFERYQRSEKALVGALTEMYVQGVSTRKVKAITEELCGHEFSASTISRLNQNLDEELDKFAGRRLEEPYPYLILDARYEKAREEGVIRSQAVMIAIGVDWEGRRDVLAVELAHRESQSSWKEFCLQLKTRGLSGVELVISDDHAGLRKAIAEVFAGAAWQRCYVLFGHYARCVSPRMLSHPAPAFEMCSKLWGASGALRGHSRFSLLPPGPPKPAISLYRSQNCGGSIPRARK